MSKNNAPHILNTASNLLGLCFIVITAIHVQDSREASFIDEFTAVAVVFLIISAILSFLSLRTNNEVKSIKTENMAGIFFLLGLISIFASMMVIVFTLFFPA